MDVYTLVMLVVLFAFMYFAMIRPESKRKKQAEEMRNNLKKGDQITTIGGIVGKIVMINEETIIIETSEDRVRMELTKWAVSVNNTQQQAIEAERQAKKAAKDEAKKNASEDK